MPSTTVMRGVGGVMALIGLGILIGTAVPLSQEVKKPANQQDSSRKTGLGVGIAIGAIMLIGGIYMLVTGAGGSNNSSNNSKQKVVAAASAEGPLNAVIGATKNTAKAAAVQAEIANQQMENAEGAARKLKEVQGVLTQLSKVS